MNEFDNDQDLRPDLTARIDNRMMTLEKALLEFEGTLYKTNFFKRLPVEQKERYDRLRNHYNLNKTQKAGKDTAAFGFKDTSNLDFRFKERCFELFFKHFPDGVQTSLIGYPNDTYQKFKAYNDRFIRNAISY
jgi:hypothetical protein